MFTFAAQDTWWMVLLGFLSQLGLSFASVLLPVLGLILVRWVAKKMNITDVEKMKAMDAMYDSAVTLGVNYAEQKAKLLDNDPDASGKKLKMATDVVAKAIADFGLPAKTADWVESRIEAKLGDKLAPKPE